MRTPRPGTRRTTTLIGNAWLHEAPANPWPRGWDIRSRSSLRKCMFLPMPPIARALLEARPPVVSLPSRAAGAVIAPPNPAPHRHRPEHDVRVFAAVSPEEVYARKRAQLVAEARAKLLAKPAGRAAASSSPARWYEDPVALGTLLLVLPPIGLAALWSSKRYSSDARWALTIMTALTLSLGAAITIVVLTLRP